MPFDPGLQKVYLMAEAKHCIMATFNQNDFLPPASDGACLELTIRFIIQSLRGLPPLGIDLEKGIHQDILRVPANSAIYRKFPNINDAIRPSSPFSNPGHSVHVTYESGEQLIARVKQDGFKLIRIVSPITFTDKTFLKSMMTVLHDKIDIIRTTGKGWVLFIISKPGKTHALAFHAGNNKHLMFVDVNSGWYYFTDVGSTADFLKRYWEYMEYGGYNRFAAYCMAVDTNIRAGTVAAGVKRLKR